MGTPLLAAIKHGHLAVVEKLLAGGQRPARPLDPNQADGDGNFPLLAVCAPELTPGLDATTRCGIVALLLSDPEVAVNQCHASSFCTPLRAACAAGESGVVDLMLDLRAGSCGIWGVFVRGASC